MEQAEVEKRLHAALGMLRAQDGYLLDVGAHERSITHKLGCYLQNEFPNWDVDCEYNRDGHCPKKVTLDETKFSGESSVYPDIIIHKRGREGPNLLVIEVKSNPDKQVEAVKRDLNKLRAYKRKLDYEYAVFIKVWTGENHPDPHPEFQD